MIGFRWISTNIVAVSLAALIASSPARAGGECLAWNATGLWLLTQSNGTHVTFHLQQTDTRLQGVGDYSHYNNDNNKVQTIGGPLDGTIESGFRVWVTAYWSNGTAGKYVGEIQADGGMKGYTVDVNDPGNKATFVASGYPQCLTRAAAAPPPAKPVVALGRVQMPAGTPAAPAKSMCEMAASARARNSPAAPGLEKRCAEQGGSSPTVAFGRVPTPATAPATPAALPPFDPAVLDTLADTGALIAQVDPTVAEARSAKAGAFYQLGFDIGTGLFGDPALGAQGNTLMGPGSQRIRDHLSAAGQRGFDDSVKFHLARDYRSP